MTLSIYEFTDTTPGNEDPIYPAVRRRTGLALSATYHQIGETALVRGVLVYNDSGTAGFHIRVTTAASGEDATQGDVYVGPDQTAYFVIQRKDRASTNPLYINAVADT